METNGTLSARLGQIRDGLPREMRETVMQRASALLGLLGPRHRRR
jgi:hypothetical protein